MELTLRKLFLFAFLFLGGDKMIINGKEYSFQNITINHMLNELKLNKDKVVVEVNFEIVSKDQYEEFILDKSASVEIVSFIGGG